VAVPFGRFIAIIIKRYRLMRAIHLSGALPMARDTSADEPRGKYG